jgi:hypothetical protein
VKFVKAEPKTLRELSLGEKWLHDKIVEDPSILGLGDVTVIERERSQPTGGRLDLLLSDPEEGIRYEVEIMLGRLDESHIIRSIEYWDVERTRFPQLEHRAVIVAEDITNRFFNVISLLNRAVPIIAIQMSVMQVQDSFVLAFLKVLDVAELFGEDEDDSGAPVDRAYWEKRSNPTALAVVDKIITLLPSTRGSPRVTYNKHHIAIGTSGRNFIWLHPRKNASHCHMQLLLDGDERTDWVKKLDDVGIFAGPRGKEMKMRLSQKELMDNEALIRELLAKVEALSRG